MAVTIKDFEHAGFSRPIIQKISKSGLLGTPSTQPSTKRGRPALVYPDFALDVCLKIRELREEGRSLREAMGKLHSERVKSALEKLRTNIGESLDTKKAKLGKGKEVRISSVFLGMILHEIGQFIKDREKLREISRRMREENLIDLAFRLLEGGYNPTLMFNESEMRIIADFQVAHYLSRDANKRTIWIVVPLLPATQGIVQGLSAGEIKPEPVARPARKIVAKQGKDLVQYDIYLTGLGFEVIRSSARVIGTKK